MSVVSFPPVCGILYGSLGRLIHFGILEQGLFPEGSREPWKYFKQGRNEVRSVF